MEKTHTTKKGNKITIKIRKTINKEKKQFVIGLVVVIVLIVIVKVIF